MRNLTGFILFLFLFVLYSCSEKQESKISKEEKSELAFPFFLEEDLKKEKADFSLLKNDSDRYRYLHRLSDKLPARAPDLFRYMIAEAGDSSRHYQKLYAIKRLARVFQPENKFDSIEFYLKMGVRNCENNPRYDNDQAEFYRLLGNQCANFSKSSDAITYFDKAIKLTGRTGNKEKMFRYISEIGRIYLEMKKQDKALECYLQGRDFAEKNNDYGLLVYTLNSMGDIFRLDGKAGKAIEMHEAALVAHKKSTGEDYETWACTSLGKCHAELKDLFTARKYFGLAMYAAQKSGNLDLQAQAEMNLALVDHFQKLNSSAIKHAVKAHELSERAPVLETKLMCSKILYYLYKENQQYENALALHEKYKFYSDSLQNNENVRKFAEAEFKMKEDKLLLKIEQDKQFLAVEKEKRQQESRRHALIVTAVTVVLLISVAFAFYVLRSLRHIRVKNKIIEEKQTEILESIHYARRIQNSFLPKEKYISRIIGSMLNRDSENSSQANS